MAIENQFTLLANAIKGIRFKPVTQYFTFLNLSFTLLWRRFLLYRNQPINLLSQSMDWFLFDRDLRHKKLKWKKSLETNRESFWEPVKDFWGSFFFCRNYWSLSIAPKSNKKPLVSNLNLGIRGNKTKLRTKTRKSIWVWGQPNNLWVRD